MSHGNATPEDARQIGHWIEEEMQIRKGSRACMADLRRERDRVEVAFKKILQERRKIKQHKSDFKAKQKQQQNQCEQLHTLLDGQYNICIMCFILL